MQTLLNFIQGNIELFYVVILSVFLGIEVISRVPSVLHTPLMSGANAIHGVIIIGSIIVNVVGGFVVTNRMLEMFKTGKDAASKKIKDN
jgi:NAD(P) transhydrogenase subunit alpha